MKINTFAGMPCWAIGQAVTTCVGLNIGANKKERVKEIVRVGLYLNILITLIVVICIQIFAESILRIFDPSNTEVIEVGLQYLRICCSINSLFYAVMYTCDSFAIGIGLAKVAMLNALIDAMLVRLPLSWILAFTCQMGFTGIYFGQALSPIIPAIIGYIYYMKWKTRNVFKSNNENIT